MCAKRRRSNRGRQPQPAPKTLPDDLYDYDAAPDPANRMRREDTPLLGPDGQKMRVTDDWPDYVPVTEAEIQVFERWFGDFFDELLTLKRSRECLHILSQTDKKNP